MADPTGVKPAATWILTLECGHNATRRVRTRRWWNPDRMRRERVEDPAPCWVYCPSCGHSRQRVVSALKEAGPCPT